MAGVGVSALYQRGGHHRVHARLVRRDRHSPGAPRERHRRGTEGAAAAHLDGHDCRAFPCHQLGTAQLDGAPDQRNPNGGHAWGVLYVHHRRALGWVPHRLHHRVLHVALVQPSAGGGACDRDGRGDQHHLRPGPGLPVGDCAGHDSVGHHLCVAACCGHVRRGLGRAGHVVHPVHLPRHRRVRAHFGQCGRHRRDGGAAVVGARQNGRARCRRQHHGGDRQGLCHWLSGTGVARALWRICDARVKEHA